MVKVEMYYNPYNLKTTIKFNNQKPRINSMIEKFESEVLQDWIEELPDIFENEMNGFNFELVFDGTELDFEDLKDAFNRKNINDKDPHSKRYVKFTHNNIIEKCEDKIERIEELHKCLEKDIPIEYQDKINKYLSDYKLEKDFSLFFVSQNKMENRLFGNMEVSINNLDIDDLLLSKNEDISNIPIIIELNENNKTLLIKKAIELVQKKSIRNKQLFFMISGTKEEMTIIRHMLEEGIIKPQFIENVDDSKLLNYLNNYSFSNYVRNTINELRRTYAGIHEYAEDDKKNAASVKSSEQMILSSTNDEKNRIEGVLNRISVNRYKLDSTVGENDIKELIDNIYSWKKFVKVIKNEKEAIKKSKELEDYINKQVANLQSQYLKFAITEVTNIKNHYFLLCKELNNFNTDIYSISFNYERSVNYNSNLSYAFFKQMKTVNKTEKGKVITEIIYNVQDW